uniref:non-specific serine/threonine protein kinase n=1 Tax=Fagus sylvatica TaxID=28930 RepID=A0A2N9HT53_FAGSY
MANRDEPVDGRGSTLSLLNEGKLILTNSLGFVIWQSFDSPIDTLLPQQALTMISSLISRRSQDDYSSGNYKLFFDNDNVLRLLFQGPTMSSLYWPDPWLTDPGQAGRSMYNTSRRALLDDLGNFESSDHFQFNATDYGVVLHRRLTLDPDGNLRSYSLQEMNGRWDWVVTYQAFSQPCRIHGICGPNSLCSYDHVSGRKCSCLQGFKMKDHTDWSYGCEPEFSISCNNTDESSFVQLAHVEYYGSDIEFHENATFQFCRDECLKRTSKHPDSDPASQGYLLTNRFKRFSFDELRKATRGFKEVIGQGAGGTVYKGVLPDQRVAAIKQLNVANQGEAEFLAEVNTIGMLNHMYLIEMWGYCAEGKHKLLVYGIVLLEMVTGKSPNNMNTSDSGETREHKRLVTLVREYINIGTTTSKPWIEEFIDPMMAGKYDKAKMELLVKVALQCVAEDKNERPTMNQVVEMLIGHED